MNVFCNDVSEVLLRRHSYVLVVKCKLHRSIESGPNGPT